MATKRSADSAPSAQSGERGAVSKPATATMFIGLGAMGAPMASRLAAAGHELLLCDAQEDVAAALAERTGAEHVGRDQVPGVLDRVSIVVLMLPSSAVVEAVLSADDGLLGRLAPGTLVIDMGSSRPASTVRLAGEAEELGLGFVDAPVSGGVPRAVTGELSIMAGGTQAAVQQAMPVLEVLGATVTHVGPAGAGHAMKALNNLLSAIGLVGASEVLAIGAKFGLSPQVMLDVLNASTGGNHATKVKMARYVLSRSFDSGFALDLMVKDLRTAMEVAADTATPAPVAASCLGEWLAAAEQLDAAADHTHIAAYVEAQAGIELR